MIVYLAAYKSLQANEPIENISEIYLLSSFWEHKGGIYDDYVRQERHILDSGAFSAFTGKNNNYDWDDYVCKYADFIIKNKIKLYFELDIDCIVGLEKVEYYRKYLEDRTGMQPIPVWHATRGKEYFVRMCQEYPYVAIGTTSVAREGQLIRSNPMILKWFIDEAHRNNAKIHGLGFTDTVYLPYLKFDSVDSTTWLSGARYGQIYFFNNKTMIYRAPPKGKRAVHYSIVNQHNFLEWVRYQKYALENL